MKDEQQRKDEVRGDERRRFLGLLGGAGVLALIFPLRHRKNGPSELSLNEAEFYRDHDLAG